SHDALSRSYMKRKNQRGAGTAVTLRVRHARAASPASQRPREEASPAVDAPGGVSESVFGHRATSRLVPELPFLLRGEARLTGRPTADVDVDDDLVADGGAGDRERDVSGAARVGRSRFGGVRRLEVR